MYDEKNANFDNLYSLDHSASDSIVDSNAVPNPPAAREVEVRQPTEDNAQFNQPNGTPFGALVSTLPTVFEMAVVTNAIFSLIAFERAGLKGKFCQDAVFYSAVGGVSFLTLIFKYIQTAANLKIKSGCIGKCLQNEKLLFASIAFMSVKEAVTDFTSLMLALWVNGFGKKQIEALFMIIPLVIVRAIKIAIADGSYSYRNASKIEKREASAWRHYLGYGINLLVERPMAILMTMTFVFATLNAPHVVFALLGYDSNNQKLPSCSSMTSGPASAPSNTYGYIAASLSAVLLGAGEYFALTTHKLWAEHWRQNVLPETQENSSRCRQNCSSTNRMGPFNLFYAYMLKLVVVALRCNVKQPPNADFMFRVIRLMRSIHRALMFLAISLPLYTLILFQTTAVCAVEGLG